MEVKEVLKCGHRYCEVCVGKILDSDSDGILQMIQKNSIQGLLPLEVQTIDGIQKNLYETDGLLSLKDWYEKKELNKQYVYKIIEQISNMLERGREYFLEDGEFFLSGETIYLDDEETCHFIYVPGLISCLAKQMEQLFEFFMREMNPNDRELALYIYDLYRISKLPQFTLGKCLVKESKYEMEMQKDCECMVPPKQEENRNIEEPINLKRKENYWVLLVIGLVFLGISACILQSNLLRLPVSGRLDLFKAMLYCIIMILLYLFIAGRFLKKEKLEGGSILHSEKILEFSQERDGSICMTPVEQDYKELYVNEFPFYIGAGQVDGILPYAGVSRIHGQFQQQEGKVYYIDEDSTNGSYLNQKRLLPYEKNTIKKGDYICFGNITYRITQKSCMR